MASCLEHLALNLHHSSLQAKRGNPDSGAVGLPCFARNDDSHLLHFALASAAGDVVRVDDAGESVAYLLQPADALIGQGSTPRQSMSCFNNASMCHKLTRYQMLKRFASRRGGAEKMKRIVKGLIILLFLAVVALLAWGWESDRDPAVLRQKYSNAASQFVDVGGGLTMHVRVEGKKDGPVLVLLHGSNSSLQTWEPWVARLGGKYRVISFDQIGHGLTGPNPAHDYSAKSFVDTADALLTKLGVQKFALGGNSMGGWVAWHYALAHPEKLTALILVDAAGAPNSESKSVPLGFKIARMPIFKTLMLHVTPRAVFAKTIHQTLSNDAIITDKMIDTYWELALYPGSRQATGERFATPRVPIDEAAIHALKVPTLVMWGEEDTLIPVSASHWFAKAIPGAKEIVYPHIGHIPMEEAADQSAKDVDMFLSGLGLSGVGTVARP